MVLGGDDIPLVQCQTAELGTAAPDILFAENFCAPELRNTFHALKIGSLAYRLLRISGTLVGY